MFFAIDPIAFQIGNIEVRWYGILMALALGLGTYLAYKEAERQDIDPEHFLNLVLVGAPIAWICARLYYVVFNWNYYSQYPGDIIKIWEGGLAIHGGIIGAILVGIVYTRLYRLPFWKIADISAPSFILGQAIGRWGNFFNQEAYGRVTDLPWAMYIDGAYRHPTFLYESLWNLGIFTFLIWRRRKPSKADGHLFLIYLILYSIGRFVIESFRTDSLMIGPLRTAQVISVIILIVAAALMFYLNKPKFKNKYR